MSNINTVVSSMSYCVVVYFLKAITYMYLAFTSKKQVSKGLLTGVTVNLLPSGTVIILLKVYVTGALVNSFNAYFDVICLCILNQVKTYHVKVVMLFHSLDLNIFFCYTNGFNHEPHLYFLLTWLIFYLPVV